MKLTELMKTPIAKAASKKMPDKSYLEWLRYAVDTNVIVFKDKEIGPYKSWAIQVIGTDYWLECTSTKQEALELCKKMGWRVAK